MNNFLGNLWRKPVNEVASTSTVQEATNIVNYDNNTIGTINVVNMAFPNATINNLNSKETKKNFPIKYHVIDLEDTFRGREDKLAELKSHLLPDDVDKTKATTVIFGLAGIGKTELARKFALEYENDFNGNILWISAETQVDLKTSFESIAELLEINKVNDIKINVNKVYSYFKNTSCLFVFDNAETMQDINDYLPSKSDHSTVKYSILITSIEKRWGNNIPVVELNELPLHFAEEVAKAIISEEKCKSYELPLHTIVEFVDRIPLGIQIISHLILNEIDDAIDIEVKFSFTEFFKTLEDKMLLDEEFPKSSRNSYTKSIFIAIKLAINRIENCSERGSKEALDVLHTVAYLSPDDIDTEMLLLVSVQPSLNKALAILSKFSIIRVKSNKIIIHRLVQKSICLYQERKQEHFQEQYINATLNILYDPLTAWKVPRIHRNYINKHKNCIKLCIDWYSRTKSQLFLYTLVEQGNEKILSEIINNLPENEKEDILIDSVLLRKATNNPDGVMLTFLLDNGFRLQEYEYGPNSLLVSAFDSENWDAAIVLIQNGCDVNTRDINGIGKPLLFKLCDFSAGIYTKPVLELLLAKGANVLAKCYDQTLLHHLLGNQTDLELIKYLCEKTKLSKYINEKYVNGMTPLHTLFNKIYIEEFNADEVIEVTEYLIQKGANRILKTKDEETLLHIAVTTTSLKLVKYVIKLVPGVINEVDIQGKTALHKLMSSDDIEIYREEIAKYLIDNNSDLNVVDKQGQTILHAATKHFRPDILDYILEKENNINVNAQDINGYTILHNCLISDYHDFKMENDYQKLIKLISYLKDRSFDFNLKTKHNETLLHFAASIGNLKLIQTIFEVPNDYDIDTQDIMGLSVLHWLLHDTYYENSLVQVQSCFEYLISHGANINLINLNKQTILHLCAIELNNKLMELILSEGMNFNHINSQDVDGNTALHKLCRANDFSENSNICANILLDNGADMNIQNNENKTALDLAVNECTYSLIKAITQHPKFKPDTNQNNIDQMLLNLMKVGGSQIYNSDVNKAQFLNVFNDFIKMGANVNVINEKQQNLLHIAAYNRNFELIKLICENKQFTNKINDQDNKGNTALLCCLQLNFELNVKDPERVLKSIEYLMSSKRGDLTIKNNLRQTALHLAARPKLMIVKFIVESCKKYPTFNINDQDLVGNTALHYLCRNAIWQATHIFENEFFAVLYYLLSNGANPEIINKEDKTPSQFAYECELYNISQYLDEYIQKNNNKH